MGVHVLEFPELAQSTAGRGPAAPGTGRFAHWSPALARAVLAVLALLLLASALVPVAKPGTRSPWQGPVEGPVSAAAKAGVPAKPYDEDIALYEAAADRIAHGENYYDFIVDEQRSRTYPVNPGLAVRLPALAYFDAWLGTPGQIAGALAVMPG